MAGACPACGGTVTVTQWYACDNNGSWDCLSCGLEGGCWGAGDIEDVITYMRKKLRAIERTQREEAERRITAASAGIKRLGVLASHPLAKIPKERMVVSTNYLGGGAEARVFEGFCMGRKVAVKEFFGSSGEQMRSEIKALEQVNGHPHIVKYLAEYNGPNRIAMELLEGPDLNKRLHETGRPISADIKTSIMLQIADALFCLHEKGIFHNDVKSSNVFIVNESDEEIHVKLGDFGISMLDDTQRGTSDMELRGTVAYMAPELIEGSGKPSRESDMFAYGVLAREVFARAIPWQGKHSANIILCVARKDFSGVRLSDVPSEFQEFVAGFMQVKPSARWAAQKAFEFFNVEVLYLKAGLNFVDYDDFHAAAMHRKHCDARLVSVGGGAAYGQVSRLLNKDRRDIATVFYGKQCVFGKQCRKAPSGQWYANLAQWMDKGHTRECWFEVSEDDRWEHPTDRPCGRHNVKVPLTSSDAMWREPLTGTGVGNFYIAQAGETHPCWCCAWRSHVEELHMQGYEIQCASSNIFEESWVTAHSAGSTEVKGEKFRNGTPPGWGSGQMRVYRDGLFYQEFARAAHVHADTGLPLGEGCRWERQVLDGLGIPVRCFFMP